MKFDDVEKLAKQIQAKLFKNSNSTIQGIYRSRFKGSGITFKEHKIYTHGDDVRFIDWKVSTRNDKMYVKTFEEERNVKISIFLDLSNSMTLGWENKSKIEAGAEICYLFYLLSDKTKDLINLNFISDKIYETSWSSGKRGLANLIMFMSRNGILNKDGKIDLTLKDTPFTDRSIIRRKILYNLQSKKEVLLISDLCETVQLDSIEDFLSRPNFHCVKLEAPIDTYKKDRISAYGQESINGKLKTSIKGFNSSSSMEEKIHKKLKIVSLDNEKYLEDFVKNMVY
jgi:uncharacterized protein (DUF58 family)